MGGKWSKLDGSDLSALWVVGNVWGHVLMQGHSAVDVGWGAGLIMGEKAHNLLEIGGGIYNTI
jgi:hypothetical protein